jgi:hypothetical protein
MKRGNGSRASMCKRQPCARQSAKAAKLDGVIHRCIFKLMSDAKGVRRPV